jgi:hypothetical protein
LTGPLSVAEEQLKDIVAERTAIAGKAVFERREPQGKVST